MSKGFTLIELMVTVAAVAILATLAAPSMSDMIDRRRLASQVEGVSSLIQLARSEAIRRSAGGSTGVVSVAIEPGASWFVGLSNDAAGCTAVADCTINQGGADISKVWQNTDCGSCSLTSPELRQVIVFTLRGVVSGGTDQAITIQSPQGKQVSISVSAIGRVSSCSPTSVPGYPSC